MRFTTPTVWRAAYEIFEILNSICTFCHVKLYSLRQCEHFVSSDFDKFESVDEVVELNG